MLDKQVTTLSPRCPLCSDHIRLAQRDFHYVVCRRCEISFSGFELFDSLPHAGSSDDDRILPFGVMVSDQLKPDVLRRLLCNMERVFELVVAREAPGGLCSEAHFVAYVISLVEGQWLEHEGSWPGSWALVRHDKCAKNLHDEFVYLPTYLAVGTLSFALQEMPRLLEEIPTLQRSLGRGLDFATLRGLAGHNYQWLEWRRRVLTIFERGKVLDLLLDRPEMSFRMCYALGYIHQRTVEILSKTQGPIEYETRGPVARNVYEWIADRTAAFQHFCSED